MSGETIKASKTVTTLNGKGNNFFTILFVLTTNLMLIFYNTPTAITITLEGDRAFTDDAKVLTTDTAVDNGVLHIIDYVMMPGA